MVTIKLKTSQLISLDTNDRTVDNILVLRLVLLTDLFDPCASVEILDFPEGMNFVDFTNLCLNERKKTCEKEPDKQMR